MGKKCSQCGSTSGPIHTYGVCRTCFENNERSGWPKPPTEQSADEVRKGDPNKSTQYLIDTLMHFHNHLTTSGECIDNDCDVCTKPYAKIIADRLQSLSDKVERAKKRLWSECRCRIDAEVDISVGQEYERCTLCEVATGLEEK